MGIFTLIALQFKVPTRFVLDENHTGKLIVKFVFWMRGTEEVKEIVLVEAAPFTPELLIHWQLLSGEAEYTTEVVCRVTKVFPNESKVVRVKDSEPAPQGFGIVIYINVILL